MSQVVEQQPAVPETNPVEEAFMKVNMNISNLANGLKEILSEIKQLEKDYKKLKVKKKAKSSASSKKNDELNNTPLKCQEGLCKFLSLKSGELVSRKQARDGVTAYIKTQSLQDKDRMFKLDPVLKKLFNTKDSPQYYIHIKKLIECNFSV
jgi:hypothetical protein